MANPFLALENRDVETAILLEKAIITNIGKAIAYTDGDRIFINTEDNLYKLLPAYDGCTTLKLLLWHEQYHKELRHHARYFKYLKELETMSETLNLTHSEVNIIMDILVHDSLLKAYPELVETATKNLAQLRNRNSLEYTFKTFTLEKMLAEYSEHKHKDDEGEGDEGTGDEGTSEGEGKDAPKEKSKTITSDEPASSATDEEETSEHKDTKDGHGTSEKSRKGKKPEVKDEPIPKQEKTNWSKLKEIDNTEFIRKYEGDELMAEVNRLKSKKFKLAKLTETLNGLVTSTRQRTYAMPSTTYVGRGVLLKGSKPGHTQLYLCFDASGSMSREMETFKEIISKSIPQAMETPTTWFSGYCYKGNVDHCKDPAGRSDDYYKGKFKDFMTVSADSGYGDDGDRTIELCWKAEQMGYSPIGITDGGGKISWSKDMLKQLKRTILVSKDSDKWWLEEAQKINPKIQILDIDI